jgi:hypothetical protein
MLLILLYFTVKDYNKIDDSIVTERNGMRNQAKALPNRVSSFLFPAIKLLFFQLLLPPYSSIPRF